MIIDYSISTGSVSAAEISRRYDLRHATTWRMFMKIREELLPHVNSGILQDQVEGDEAWFSHKDNQEIVLGLVQRKQGKIRRLILKIIANVKEETLYPLIKKHVQPGSSFYTDQRISYSATGIRYHHQTTNHSAHEFARGTVHSNTIEQIWGDIKGIIRTIHHGVSKKYRPLYLAQYIFRYEQKYISNLFLNFLSILFHPTYCVI
jgi:transposase-like protein